MLRRLSLPWVFVLAALVTMVLAAGGVWQLARPADDMLNALGPTWIGIAAVFWVLWRQVAPDGAAKAAADLPPAPLTTDFEPLHLDRRYADLARLSLDALEYVVVDTETTGLDTDRDHIVQIGAVRIVGGEVREGDRFARLVNPGRAIPQDSTRFHGITDEMVADAPAIEEALAEFADYAGNAVLIGHNIAFDLSILSRAGKIENPMLDTMLLSIGAFPRRLDHTLDALADHFEEPVRERHNALGDAELTARLFLRLLPELDRVGARQFGDAQDLCADSADRIRNMPTGR
jgi:DNA polymerase III epsilon subunit family exonuclease